MAVYNNVFKKQAQTLLADGYGTSLLARIYSVYRVINNYNTQTGMTTAWAQQRRELLDHNITTNPRQQVISDLLTDVQAAIDDVVSVMIMADMNEQLHSVEKTNERLEDLGLFNVM